MPTFSLRVLLPAAALILSGSALQLSAAVAPPPTDFKPRPPPPPPLSCPPSCAYDSSYRHPGCGIYTHLANGSYGFVCPKALLFSTGFDSDMVLQRAPAKAAIYGHLVGEGGKASISVTVSRYGRALESAAR